MNKPFIATALTLLLAGSPLALAADPAVTVDWSGMPKIKANLFYPGETSLEWVYSKRGP